MVWEAVDEFPQASVAVHVRVILYDPAQDPLVVTSINVRVNALPQASTAVATAKTGTVGQLIVKGAGNAAITGALLSSTFMVWEVVDVLPHTSVAVQVRVTLYDPAHAPGVVASAKVSATAPPQPSTAVAMANTGEAGQYMV